MPLPGSVTTGEGTAAARLVRGLLGFRAFTAWTVDPRTVPGLLAGGIWLPGVGVSSLGGGSRRWASQADNTGDDYDLKDSHTGHKPVATTAGNGAAIWDLAAGGATAGWSINTGITARPPGAALQPTTRGSFAGWFKANALDTAIHVFASMWAGGTSGNRFFLYKNDDNHRCAVFTSWNGSAQDIGTPLYRSKWNSGSGPGAGPLTDWTGWHFLRIAYDMGGTNLLLAGGKYSTRLRVFVDETELANDTVSGCGGYSAGSPPADGGPIAGVHNAAGRFSVGADFASSQWNGQIGPVYVSNEDATDAIDASTWRGVMRYGAPGEAP